MSPDAAASRPDPAVATLAVDVDAFCYGPLAERLDPADLAGSDGPQRWSDAGAPTVYLASDIGVALAEWGRHIPVDERRDDSGLWRVPVRLSRAVDLRRLDRAQTAALGQAAGLDPCPDGGEPAWCLDPEVARDIAAWLRYVLRVDGLVVPSVAFLDDPARGNLVVFVDDPAGGRECLGEPSLVAAVRWTDRAPATAHLDTRVQVPAVPVFGRR